MQFAVPQFTEVEDKLIGPLTLKQFLILLAAGGFDLFLYSIFKISLLFFLLALPVAILGIAMAFGSFNGRPFFTYTYAFLSFIFKPKSRVFSREIPIVTVMKTDKKPEPIIANKTEEEPDASRLKKLAYMLDQKTVEEKELIKKQTNG